MIKWNEATAYAKQWKKKLSSFLWSYMYVFSFNGYPTMGIGDDTVKKLTAD